MAENVVNVTFDKEFAAAVLQGIAEQITDDLTAVEIRDILITFAEHLKTKGVTNED